MGITIVQKSDLSVRKRNAKVALVLGRRRGHRRRLQGRRPEGPRRLPRQPQDHRFRHLRRLSAGAVLAAPLAAGISPAEMIRSLEGTSSEFSIFRARDFYNPNFASSSASRPLHSRRPGDVPARLDRRLRRRDAEARRGPAQPAVATTPAGRRSAEPPKLFTPIARAMLGTREFPVAARLPAVRHVRQLELETYLRSNLERNEMSNDFSVLYRAHQARSSTSAR